VSVRAEQEVQVAVKLEQKMEVVVKMEQEGDVVWGVGRLAGATAAAAINT
jgi:hypothetical protein